MPRNLKPKRNFHDPRFTQISESHCGPAVVQMLLSNVGIEVSQEDVAESGGAASLIELNGMRVDQLARAVRHLAPQVAFYYKEHATLNELARVVNDYGYPVGVEWQGLFDDEEEEEEDDLPDAPAGLLPDSETEDSDYGHYSLVVHANRRKKQLIIADPYKDYVSQARIFGFREFEDRWYDFNEITDPLTGELKLVEDERMMFVVVRRSALFPKVLGMLPG